jgi:hypothetical protein
MGSFTTFAFDGLKKRGKGKSKAKRRTTKAKRRSGFGAASRAKVRVCGCKVRRTKNGRPMLVCPDNPMQRFVSEAEAAKIGRGETCTTVLKPVK